MGLATGKAVEAIARQPEAAGKVNSSLLFGLILMETCAVYALLVAILVIFILGGRVTA
jgi:F-type H+-transporting ATPase subunit c